MIFGQIKMLITILLITGIAGAGMYVMKLRSDNAILKANQLKLETAVAEQNKVLEQQEKDFKAIMESNKKLNVLINTFKHLLWGTAFTFCFYKNHTRPISYTHSKFLMLLIQLLIV